MQLTSLYTWLDIELVFQQLQASGELPDWFVRRAVYQTDLLISVLAGTAEATIRDYLTKIFGARYRAETGISLESSPNSLRFFPVEIEEVDASESNAISIKLIPSFNRVSVFPGEIASKSLPSPLPAGSPEVVAFYSFKGGVGRTTHLLGYLQALTSKKLRALVIDADMEAPGITTLLQHEHSFRSAEYSLVDFLAMIQSDRSPDWEETLSLATYQVRRQALDVEAAGAYVEHYFLPAFKSELQAMRSDIRPEHIVARTGKAWIITEIFANLGRRVGADIVLVDLRAGYSELASPLLFDPRVRRILVSTPSQQSLDGTSSILRQLAKFASSASALRDPALILSFVLSDLLDSEMIVDASSNLLNAYPISSQDRETAEGNPESLALSIRSTAFAQELLYVSSINDAIRKLASTSVSRTMAELLETDFKAPSAEPIPIAGALDQVRERLASLAEKLEYAESGKGNDFLKVAPLRALARQFSDEVPIAVVIGQKGAGKTYTYLQIVRLGKWNEFIAQISGTKGEFLGPIWPLFRSQNLLPEAEQIIEQCKRTTTSELGTASRKSNTEVQDSVTAALKNKDADETWWRHRWFGIIATALGIPFAGDYEAAESIVRFLNSSSKNVVVVIDGLEDLFPVLGTNSAQQLALRVLIQGVPNYLREIPDCPLGLLVFVRADLAQSAIPQNFGQFSKLYEPFMLRWNQEEALRLAVWLARASGLALKTDPSKPIELLTVDEARDALTLLWGYKLGHEGSREARSAEWVIAALSDFNGQVQARDLVRFLRYSADESKGYASDDRVLSARAIRDAIVPCSTEKISEIKQEIPQLQSIFAKLQDKGNMRIPFDAAGSGLTADEIRFLQQVGVVVEDRGDYFMPEIFRLGLGFKLLEGARPRVLSLARRFIRS